MIIEEGVFMARLNIQDMYIYAAKHGGICLSTEYINNSTPVLWQCAKGHQWDARPTNVQQGSWCPHCSNRFPKYTIEEIQSLAKSRGGICLSNKYPGINIKMDFQCQEGHTFSLTMHTFKKGNWCPQCKESNHTIRRPSTISIERLHKLAKEHGGNCLYQGTAALIHKKIPWSCSKGHEFLETTRNIRNGVWCHTCSPPLSYPRKYPYTIEDMHAIAALRKGFCLSTTYLGSKERIRWKCQNGHEFEKYPPLVLQGEWCKECNAIYKRSIWDKKAQEHNLTCISMPYDERRTLRWQCKEGHEWLESPSHLEDRKWLCPICQKHKRLQNPKRIAKKNSGKCRLKPSE